MATLGEMMLASSMRSWSERPGLRLVKVLSPSGYEHAMKIPREECRRRATTPGAKPCADDDLRPLISGYLTQEKYLFGLTAPQIERVLGLRSGELGQTAKIYSLSRLPGVHEVDFRLSAAFPDGKLMDDEAWAAHLEAREAYRLGLDLNLRSMVPVIQSYPPGSAMVPQWCLKPAVAIKAGPLLATVTAQFALPRENASIKPYTPHNRGPIR